MMSDADHLPFLVIANVKPLLPRFPNYQASSLYQLVCQDLNASSVCYMLAVVYNHL